MINRTIAIALLFACLTATVQAAKKPSLRFTKYATLPEARIKLKIMSGAMEQPLPSPAMRTYNNPETGAKEERFHALVLWQRKQIAGSWADSFETTLTVASMTSLPGEYTRRSITHDDLQALMEKTSIDAGTVTEEDMDLWTRHFADAEDVTVTKVPRPPRNLSDLYRMSFDSGVHAAAYIFRLNRKLPGQRDAPDCWFFVMVTLHAELDIKRAETEMESKMLPSILYVKPRTLSTTGRLSSRAGARATNPASNEMSASRAQVLNSIRNMKDWWHAETKHYLFLSNLKSKLQVNHLKKDIECLHAAYSHLIKPRVKMTSVSVIRVFATEEEYLSYVGEDFQWSAGIWIPRIKEMVIRPRLSGSRKDMEERMNEIIYHEGFHQYLHFALDERRNSSWFNEGHAEFFATAHVSNYGLVTDENEDHVDIIKELIDTEELDIEGMLRKTASDFYAEDEDERRANYALAWALVYYMRKSGGTDSAYSQLLNNYCDLLMKTGNPLKTTETIFESIDMTAFKEDFSKFWFSSAKRNAAKKLRLFKGLGRKG